MDVVPVGNLVTFVLVQFSDAADVFHVFGSISKEPDAVAPVGEIGINMVHVEVDVKAKVVLQTILEGFHVGSAAVKPLFLTTPRAEAKGALGLARFVDNLADLTAHLEHAGCTGRVINRSLTVVNGIVVATNDDHF